MGTSDPGAAGPGLLGTALVDGVAGAGLVAALLLSGAVTVLIVPPDGVLDAESIDVVLVATPGATTAEVAVAGLLTRVRSEPPADTGGIDPELASADLGRVGCPAFDCGGLDWAGPDDWTRRDDWAGLDWSAATDCGVVTSSAARTARLVWMTSPARTPMVRLSTTAASTTANR